MLEGIKKNTLRYVMRVKVNKIVAFVTLCYCSLYFLIIPNEATYFQPQIMSHPQLCCLRRETKTTCVKVMQQMQYFFISWSLFSEQLREKSKN